jgi:Kef-type K+ transport system membrane component KefB
MSPDLLLLLGIAVAVGFGGGKLFQKLHLPQVVGYIVVGVFLGSSFLRLYKPQLLEQLSDINALALGLIGFMIGSELRLGVFRRLGKSIFFILIFEALSAFAVVVLAVFALTRKLYVALLFGALASATAPAATVQVLWENKAKGVLTTTLMAIVGLDDVVALILYGFAISISKTLFANVEPSILAILLKPLGEIFLSLAAGSVLGLALSSLARRMRNKGESLILSLAAILLCCGMAKTWGLSLILSNMAMGIVLANMAPFGGRRTYSVVQAFVPPIYVLFFVLVGAHLQVWLLPQMGLLGLIYLLARGGGKVLGARVGAQISRATQVVKRYLGICLISQAGVAIGLAIDAYHQFARMGTVGAQVGIMVVNIITATTFVLEILGPPCVRWAIFKAGEAGKSKS